MKRARVKTPTPSKMHIKDRIKNWLNKEIDLGEFFIIWWIVIWSIFFLILTAL
jgi:hypothetical protein